MKEKEHMILIDEAKTETTLEKLQTSILDAYEAVISHPADAGEVTIMDWFQ